MKSPVKFKYLKIGDKFTCWGDVDLYYNYPKICKCHKVGENTGKEVDGVNFSMSDNDEVDPGWD